MSLENTRSNNATSKTNRYFNNTISTLNQIASRYEEKVNTTHPSIVYEEELWRSLQTELTDYVEKRQVVMSAYGADERVSDLRYMKLFSIRTAVESLRYKLVNNPHEAHNETPWNEFREEITDTC